MKGGTEVLGASKHEIITETDRIETTAENILIYYNQQSHLVVRVSYINNHFNQNKTHKLDISTQTNMEVTEKKLKKKILSLV